MGLENVEVDKGMERNSNSTIFMVTIDKGPKLFFKKKRLNDNRKTKKKRMEIES